MVIFVMKWLSQLILYAERKYCSNPGSELETSTHPTQHVCDRATDCISMHTTKFVYMHGIGWLREITASTVSRSTVVLQQLGNIILAHVWHHYKYMY